jgi:hypothetical protein
MSEPDFDSGCEREQNFVLVSDAPPALGFDGESHQEVSFYRVITHIVKFFYLNAPKWLFGEGGVSNDRICKRNNVSNTECGEFVESLVTQRTDILLTVVVCFVCFVVGPYVYRKMKRRNNERKNIARREYARTSRQTNQKIIVFATKVVSWVSLVGTSNRSKVASIQHELKSMDPQVSRKIGFTGKQVDVLNNIIPMLDNETTNTLLQMLFDRPIDDESSEDDYSESEEEDE